MPMNKQEIFDTGVNGIRAQNYVKSVASSGSCRYRGIKGTKCIIGHCIPDSVYRVEMDTSENTSISAIMHYFPEVADLFDIDARSLMSELQNAHDQFLQEEHPYDGTKFVCEGNPYSDEKFEEVVKGIADMHGLIYTAPITST